MSDAKNHTADKWALLVIAMIGTLFGMLGGCNAGSHYLRRDAAESNAGRWVVDEKTGKTSWEWTGRTP